MIRNDGVLWEKILFVAMILHRNSRRFVKRLNAICFYATRPAKPSAPRKNNELYMMLKDEPEGPLPSYDKVVTMLGTIRSDSTSKQMIPLYMKRISRICASFSTEETVGFLSALVKLPVVKQLPETDRAEMRSVALSLVKHGVSSFSLDTILAFAKLCKELKISPDRLFMKSLSKRVVGVSNLSSDSDKMEYLKYLIALDQILVDAILFDRLKQLLSDWVFPCDIRIIDNFLLLCDSHNLEQDDDFRKIGLDAIQSSLTQLALLNLLTQAIDLPFTSLVIKMIDADLEQRLEQILSDSEASALFLSFICKRRPLPECLSALCISALQDEKRRLLAFKSIAQMYRDDSNSLPQNLREKLISTLIDYIQVHPILDKEDVDDLIEAVECVTVLNIVDAGLTGIIVLRINDLRASGKLENSFWKLASWWQLSVHRLPFNSIIPNVLQREFPHTIAALRACSVGSFVQPVSRRTRSELEFLWETLTAAHIPYTQLPRIGATPLRAHVRVELQNGNICFVFFTESGNLMQISSDALISMRMVSDCVSIACAKLSLIPIESVSSQIRCDFLQLVEKHQVEI